MSVKRQATTELNHDNWDDDDPVVQEDLSGFKVASKDILEKRVIRTAKRRSQVSNEQPKKSVFSGFGGFNKQQPASFDFLSKITNTNNENNSLTSKADSSVTSSLFTTKPFTSSPSTGLFSVQTSSASSTKSPFGAFSLPPASSGASSNTTTSSSIFTSKADSTVKDSPFKLQTVTSSTDNKIDSLKTTTSTTYTSSKSAEPTVAKSTFSPTTSLFQTKPVTNTGQSNFGIKTKDEQPSSEENELEVKNEGKMKYYSKLKQLNESVSEWIQKHVENTPLCILTPIFKDYEKYIKQIQDEYKGLGNQEKKGTDKLSNSDEKSAFGSSDTNTTAAAKNSSTESKMFSTPKSNSLFSPDQPAILSFGGIKTTTSSSIATSSTFSFGLSSKTIPSCTSTSPFSIGNTFSFASNSSTISTNSSSAPFSFGVGKPFSFNSNVIQNTEKTEENNKEEDEDTPPKVEYTPVVEKDSVYDKKCKIFVKKDGNFVDKGVGTLYIKKIEDSEKHQLLVRANTNLGTILVNLILVSAIPTQRMGKNNVMMVCIPTPDAKPPPTPILIRVKSSEEADELLATLDKYKK